jgi:hypothetical protein
MNKKFEFSKLIMFFVLLTYFIAFAFGMYSINKMFSEGYEISSSLGYLFTFVGTPVSVAIGFYSYKAKAENVEKIKNYHMTDDSENGSL